MFLIQLLVRDGASLIFIDFVARKIVSVRFCKTDYCFFEYYVEKYWIFFIFCVRMFIFAILNPSLTRSWADLLN